MSQAYLCARKVNLKLKIFKKAFRAQNARHAMHFIMHELTKYFFFQIWGPDTSFILITGENGPSKRIKRVFKSLQNHDPRVHHQIFFQIWAQSPIKILIMGLNGTPKHVRPALKSLYNLNY